MSYPKNTAICIEHLYPNAIPLDDFTVLSKTEGVFISKWNQEKLGAKPTIKKITEISIEAEKTRKFKNIRQERNRLLAETDWMSGSDVTMSDQWKKYRQDLRDLPASNADPSKIKFPTKPE